MEMARPIAERERVRARSLSPLECAMSEGIDRNTLRERALKASTSVRITSFRVRETSVGLRQENERVSFFSFRWVRVTMAKAPSDLVMSTMPVSARRKKDCEGVNGHSSF